MKSLKKVEGINVVPLIDVMLVLLTIVMTVSSFIALGKLELKLPTSSSAQQLEQKRFDISINAKKEFFINSKKIDKQALLSKLDEVKTSDTVSISADKSVPYGEFIFVIDLLKQKNIEKIGMVVTNE
jgi:biopolymer transport protein ExbD